MSVSEDKRPGRVMLRLNQELYDAIAEQADQHNRSLNGEICTSFNKWIHERDLLMLVKDRLLATAGEDTIMHIHQSTPSFDLNADGERDTCKFPVRIKDQLSEDLREAHKLYKSEAQSFVSLNAFMKMMLSWWISYSFQVSECSLALYRSFTQSNSHPRRVFTPIPATCDSARQCA